MIAVIRMAVMSTAFILMFTCPIFFLLFLGRASDEFRAFIAFAVMILGLMIVAYFVISKPAPRHFLSDHSKAMTGLLEY